MSSGLGLGDANSPRKPFKAKAHDPQNKKPLRSKNGQFRESKDSNIGKINIPLPARYKQGWGNITGTNHLDNGNFSLLATQGNDGGWTAQEVIPFTPDKDINDITNFPVKYTEAYIAYQRAKHNGIPEAIRTFTRSMKENSRDVMFFYTDSKNGEERAISLYRYRYGKEVIDIGSGIGLAEDIVISWDEDKTEFPGWKAKVVILTFRNRRGIAIEKAANIFISPSGENWIVDYTAHQYDERAPFPLVQPLNFWRAWVTKHQDDLGATSIGMAMQD